jgi:hypothetical protein
MLLPKQKIIFIHIPKCAGSSVASALFLKESYPNFKGYTKMSKHDGQTYRATLELKHNTITSHTVKNVDSFYKFTIVRNPYDRFISSYFWKKSNLKNLTLLDYLDEAEKFLEKHRNSDVLPLINKTIPHFLPQKNYVLKDGVNAMNDVFRFEDVKKVFEKLDLKYQHKKNRKSQDQAAKIHAADLEQIKQRIEQLYHMDYEYFGFSPAATKNVTIL